MGLNSVFKGLKTICKSDVTACVAPGERASFFGRLKPSPTSRRLASPSPPPPNPILIGLDVVWAVEPLWTWRLAVYCWVSRKSKTFKQNAPRKHQGKGLHRLLTTCDFSFPQRCWCIFISYEIIIPNDWQIFILVINQLDAQNLFCSNFISCLYMFRAPCAHRKEVKVVLYSIWYHHTYRRIIQFWPPDDEQIVLETCRGMK